MAQTIKLKRTAVQGKTPTTSNLDLGELAINTYDGRIFFEKDVDGTLSIQEILTTDSDVTGSLNLNGAITASSLQITGNTIIDGNLTLGGNITIGDSTTDSITVSADFSSSLIPDSGSTYDLGSSSKSWNEVHANTLYGDGSNITNITVDAAATVTASFDNQSTINVSHNFGSRNILVSTYDSNYNQLIPQTVSLTDENTVQVVLSSAHSGHVVVAKGGHIVSGSQIQIDEIASVNDTFTNQTSYTVSHTFGTKNVFVIVYDSNDNQVIPQSVSTPTTSSVELGFENATSGRVVVGKAGHIVSGSTAADFDQLLNKPSGLVSGSSQLTGSLSTIYALSGSTGVSDFGDLTNVPSGLVSGSTQITFNDVAENPFISSSNSISASGHFVPTVHESYDLGSSTQRWRDLYLSGSTIDLGGTKISRDATSGDIEFRDGSNNRKSIKVDELTIGSGASARKIKVNNGKVQFTDESDNVESSETGHVIPSANNTYDLGSPTSQFRDLYLSSASLYIDGTKVLASSAETLTFTTDAGQSIKLLETGGDDIIFQTENGNIELKGTVEVLSGKKIIDSAGTKIQFGDSLGITGSIDLTGTVDGIDLQSFSSSISTQFDSLSTDYGDLQNIPSGIVSGSSQVTSSLDSRYVNVSGNETIGGNKTFSNDVTVSGNLTVSGTTTTVDSETLNISGSLIRINYGGGAVDGGIEVTDSTISGLSTGSLLWDGTNNYWKGGTKGSESELITTSNIVSNLPSGTISGSSQITITESQISDLTHYTDSDNTNHLNSLGVISGSSQITGNLTLSGLTVDTNRLYVDSTNNRVGVGTANPTTPLHVYNGYIRVEGNNTNQYFLEGTREGVATTLRIYDNSNTVYFDTYDNFTVRANQNGGSGGKISLMGGDVTFRGSAGYDGMKWDKSENALFIGASNSWVPSYLPPSASLQITGRDGDGNEGPAGIHLMARNTGNSNWFHTLLSSDRDGDFHIATNGQGTSAPTTKFSVLQNGNVGIGTPAPGSPFHVNAESTTNVVTISRGGSDLSASTGIAQINFQADYSGSPINYGNIYAYANNVSGVRSSLDFNVKSTSGNILTGMTVYGTNSGVNVGIGTNSPSSKLQVDGTVTATSLTETSALRFKENIQEDIDSSIIDKLRPVSYDWKENKEKDYGFIAEEVSELDSILTTKDENEELLGIKYTKLIPFLVKKIQEQEERIKQLENGNS